MPRRLFAAHNHSLSFYILLEYSSFSSPFSFRKKASLVWPPSSHKVLLILLQCFLLVHPTSRVETPRTRIRHPETFLEIELFPPEKRKYVHVVLYVTITVSPFPARRKGEKQSLCPSPQRGFQVRVTNGADRPQRSLD